MYQEEVNMLSVKKILKKLKEGQRISQNEFGTLKRHSNLLEMKMFKRRFKNDKI